MFLPGAYGLRIPNGHNFLCGPARLLNTDA